MPRGGQVQGYWCVLPGFQGGRVLVGDSQATGQLS